MIMVSINLINWLIDWLIDGFIGKSSGLSVGINSVMEFKGELANSLKHESD